MKNKFSKMQIIIFIVVILIILFNIILNVRAYVINTNYKKKQQQYYYETSSCISNLYNDNLIKDDIGIDDIDACTVQVKNIDDSEINSNFINELDYVKYYLELKESIKSNYDNDILKSTVTQETIDELENKLNNIDEYNKEKLSNSIDEIKTEFNNINEIKSSVNSLVNIDSGEVNSNNCNRSKYNEVKSAVENLKQEDLKSLLLEKLINVEQYLTQKEKKEQEEIERINYQKLVNNSWIKLNVPYISQNQNKVYNGCEAASLLMALNYKGYLIGTDLWTYSTNMPKSDDPNTGFYLSIYDLEPTDIAHWIAPAPLALYGRTSSGYDNVIDISGASMDDVTNEIINGNPVIIYLTYLFKEPYNWNNGVPKNVHIQLLTGYNTVTKQYIVTDPWTSNGYERTISRTDIENLYNTIGKKAVVVR